MSYNQPIPNDNFEKTTIKIDRIDSIDNDFKYFSTHPARIVTSGFNMGPSTTGKLRPTRMISDTLAEMLNDQ